MASLDNLARHVTRLVALGVLFQKVGEEEQLQHHEDDEQLNQDDGPQRLTQAHVPESVGVEVVDPVEKTVLPHRRSGFDSANIVILFEMTKQILKIFVVSMEMCIFASDLSEKE